MRQSASLGGDDVQIPFRARCRRSDYSVLRPQQPPVRYALPTLPLRECWGQTQNVASVKPRMPLEPSGPGTIACALIEHAVLRVNVAEKPSVYQTNSTKVKTDRTSKGF